MSPESPLRGADRSPDELRAGRYELWVDDLNRSKPTAYTCTLCGSLVADLEKHDLWHVAIMARAVR